MLVVGALLVRFPEPSFLLDNISFMSQGRPIHAIHNGQLFGQTSGEDDKGSAMILLMHIAGGAKSGICNVTRQVWAHSRTVVFSNFVYYFRLVHGIDHDMN